MFYLPSTDKNTFSPVCIKKQPSLQIIRGNYWGEKWVNHCPRGAHQNGWEPTGTHLLIWAWNNEEKNDDIYTHNLQYSLFTHLGCYKVLPTKVHCKKEISDFGIIGTHLQGCSTDQKGNLHQPMCHWWFRFCQRIKVTFSFEKAILLLKTKCH